MANPVKTKYLVVLLIFAAALLIVVVTVRSSAAEIITVDDDGGADYDKIQDAINASVDGDTLRVYEGTYEENVVVNKTVNLVGNGTLVTRIISMDAKEIIIIAADNCSIRGFSIIGSDSAPPYYEKGSGILIVSDHNDIHHIECVDVFYDIVLSGSSSNTIHDNPIGDSQEYIRLLSGSHGNYISNNTASVYLEGSNFNTITNNKGVSLTESEYNTVSNCGGISFHYSNHNFVSNNSGSISLWNSDNNTILNGTCVYGRFFLIESNFNNITGNRCIK